MTSGHYSSARQMFDDARKANAGVELFDQLDESAEKKIRELKKK